MPVRQSYLMASAWPQPVHQRQGKGSWGSVSGDSLAQEVWKPSSERQVSTGGFSQVITSRPPTC